MKKAILVLAGDVHSLLAMRDFIDAEDYYILAADGGADYLRQINIKPNEIIGDLDSISKETMCFLEKENVPMIKYPSEKDDSDSALAIDYLSKKGFDKIYVWGALGKRIDHSFSNILLFSNENKDKVELIDQDYQVFCPKSGVKIKRRPNSYISIFALSDTVEGFRNKGLKYNPEGGLFQRNYPLGLSNEFIDDEAVIYWDKGEILVMIVDKDCK